MRMVFIAIVTMVFSMSLAYGATFPGSISREPLLRRNVSDRLSVGLGYERIRRDISIADQAFSDVLLADSFSGYMGYDARPWLTTFVTAGSTKLSGSQWQARDYGWQMSIGMNAYLWEGDVLTPAFAAGRLSIKGMAEVVRREAETYFGTTDWVEWVSAFTIGYEFFDLYPAAKSGRHHSLALYAGPAVSVIRGDAAVGIGDVEAFRQERNLGGVAGFDVYFAPSMSVGMKALYFERFNTGVSVRFHF